MMEAHFIRDGYGPSALMFDGRVRELLNPGSDGFRIHTDLVRRPVIVAFESAGGR